MKGDLLAASGVVQCGDSNAEPVLHAEPTITTRPLDCEVAESDEGSPACSCWGSPMWRQRR